MPKNEATSTQKYFNACFDVEDFATNQALRAHFGRVVQGNDEVYTAPFAKGESTKQLLQGWISELESIAPAWPTLFNFEIDLAKKVGPLSVMLPLAERVNDIRSYYEGILLPSIPIHTSAIAATVSEYRSANGIRLRNQYDTWDSMKKSTNSGSPYFKKKREVVKDTIPCRIYQMGDDVYQVLDDSESDYLSCAVLGWRGQEGGHSKDDVKQRVVWMFPMSVNIAELQFYQPAIESFQKGMLVPAWVSMEAVDRRITTMFDSKGDDDLVVCTDFSKFDQHFNAHLQGAARKIIVSLLTPGDDEEDWLENVFPVKYMIPLACNYGAVIFGSHGMGSGSGGTNFDETLAHRCLQYEAAILANSRLNPNSQCLGDDGILTYPGITVEDVVGAYTQHGLEMNPDKQYASSQDCTYLRRWHHKDYRVSGVCVGVYSTCRALGRLRYLERFMRPDQGWDAKAVALRQLSIIENCKFHPMKEQFVRYCMKRDDYRLGLDIPHFLDNIAEIAKEKIALMPDFLGYTKTLQSKGDPVSGISQWWVVQYLKSLSNS